jgi:hypothetical protein
MDSITNFIVCVLILATVAFYTFVGKFCSSWTPLLNVPHGHVCIVGRTSSSSSSKRRSSAAAATHGKEKEKEEEEEEEEEENEGYTDPSRYVVLNPGIRWIHPLYDQIQSVYWYAIQQRIASDGDVKSVMIKYENQFVPTKSQTFDFLPIDCMTSNGVRVQVDGNLHYRIQNPLLLVSRVDNLHQRLADILDEIIKREMHSFSHLELISASSGNVSHQFTKAIKAKFAKIGLVCEKIYIQQFSMSKELMEVLEKNITVQSKHEAELLRIEKDRERSKMIIENQLEHENQKNAVASKVETEKFKIQEIAMKQEILKTETELQLAKIKAQMDVVQKVAEEQVRFDVMEKKNLSKSNFVSNLIKECGFTPQQALDYHTLPKAYEALKESDKLIYLPSSSSTNDANSLPWICGMLQQHQRFLPSDNEKR